MVKGKSQTFFSFFLFAYEWSSALVLFIEKSILLPALPWYLCLQSINYTCISEFLDFISSTDRVNHKLALPIGACHLPLPGLNHVLL